MGDVSLRRYPEDCRCTIEPRSQEARELILRGTAIA